MLAVKTGGTGAKISALKRGSRRKGLGVVTEILRLIKRSGKEGHMERMITDFCFLRAFQDAFTGETHLPLKADGIVS
jgi:hypothetical protein